MSRILILNAWKFNQHIQNNHIYPDTAYISIRNKADKDDDFYIFNLFPEYKDYPNILCVDFDDVSEEGPTSITKQQAEQIFNFIEQHSSKKFILHCTAGVSRSGAVGEFIHDYLKATDPNYGVSYENFRKYNQQIVPNILIKSKLNDVFRPLS